MAEAPQRGSLLGSANTDARPQDTQVAGIIPPAVTRGVARRAEDAARFIGKQLDLTPDSALSKGREKARQLQENRDAAPEINTTEPPPVAPEAPPAAAPAPEPQLQGEPIPTQPDAPKTSEEVDLADNPIDEVVDPRRAVLEQPDPNDRYIRITDEDGQSLITAPQERDALLAGGLTDFNSDKMVDDAGVLERVEKVSQMYAGKINEDKRGVITLQATRQMADLIGASERRVEDVARALLERRKGEGLQVQGLGMAESMLAAKDLLLGELTKLNKLAEAAEVGGPEELAAFVYQQEFVANLQRQYKGAQTEYARTLSAMRIPGRVQPIGDEVIDANNARLRGRDLTKLLDDYGGMEQVRARAKAHLSLEDAAQKLGYARGLSKWKKLSNAAYEVWHHFLLTNPITQTKNLLGGVINTFMLSNMEMAGGALVGGVRRAMGADVGDTATFADLNAQLFGQMMAMREAFAASGRAFVTLSDEIGGSKLDRPQAELSAPFSGRGLGFDPENEPVMSTAMDVLGSVLTLGRVSYRTLQAGDTFFKVIAARGELYKQAMIGAQARGLKGDAQIDYIAEFIADPPAVALDRVEAVAKYQTLQADLDKYGKGIQTVTRAPLLRYFFPFIKTPYNSAKYTFVDRTPLGLWWGNTGAMMRAGGKQRDEAIARVSLGTGIGMTALTMALNGEITGAGPSDPRAKEALRLSGWQPYSIKIGGTYVSYAGVEPLSSILGAWADAATIAVATGGKDPKYNDVVGAALGATIYNLSNKTFMQGFANLGRAIADPEVYGVRAVDDLLQSMVPRVASYAERLNDPLLNDAKGFIEQVKKQIPGLSGDLKPRVDLLGNDIYLGVLEEDGKRNLALGSDYISPFYLSREKNSPTIRAIKAAQGLATRNFDRDINIPGLNEAVQLPDEIRYQLQKRAGKLAEQNLKVLVADPQIKRMIELAEGGNKDVQELLRVELSKVYRKSKQAALAETIAASRGFEIFIQRRAAKEAEEQQLINQGLME